MLLGHSRAGLALGAALRSAGVRIVATWNRTATRAGLSGVPVVVDFADLPTDVGFVIVAVSDDAIAAVSDRLAESWPGVRPGTRAVAFHLSGSVPVSSLAPARRRGVEIGGLHPLRAFGADDQPKDAFHGVLCGVRGNAEVAATLCELAAMVGAESRVLNDDDAGAWHLGAVAASNAVVALLDLAVRSMALAGVEEGSAVRGLGRLARGSVDDFIRGGVAAALSGPVRRGDALPLRAHESALRRLSPADRALYAASLKSLIDLADRIDPRDRDELHRFVNGVLSGSRPNIDV